VLRETPADEILIVIAFFILFVECYALYMVQQLRRRLDGRRGSYLLRVVFRFGVIVTFAQLLTALSVVARVIDYEGLTDWRLLSFMLVELAFAVAFVWTVWEIHRLPSDPDANDPSVETSKLGECICEEIDNSRSLAGTGVDQGHDHASVGPI
jgi:hypothetical protein